MKKTIFCLFSVKNEYNQPLCNLYAFWFNSPTAQDITKVLYHSNQEILNKEIGKLLLGEEIRMDNYDYRLVEIEEGVEV
ncbi:MAG: hypothetical protein A2381_19385 [Bdellovibrionales bacterium RIFOXYB1_FULL_37_110]|nr:MAG: hypothetical protein A2381_19385 [Bdellovibrionales bacterium RIFOXYB1_FULL_37_110]